MSSLHVGKNKPSYVEGRAVILRANCAGDSMRRKGLEKERNVGDQRMKSNEVQVLKLRSKICPAMALRPHVNPEPRGFSKRDFFPKLYLNTVF